ncbi:transcription factor TFIIIB component B'' homolog isoform X1 [Xenopus tropicalis]|uniref:Transcription factor TFIIIB component B'' homolog isoform X1 n=1 Tax=Xenopus tropicalis TaxID=8364 RepID=A0A8J0QPA5_XENTR|nr:transcription factor TFIIIB component B'' homolog isoform X1 [Xenopus tropicalis]
MIRRARLSFKPNVKPGGRGPGPSPGTTPGSGGIATDPNRASQEPPCPNHETVEKDNGVAVSDVAETEGATTVSAAADRGDSFVQEEEEKGTGLCKHAVPTGAEVQACATSTPLQRRKRFATLPNIGKPRVSIPSAVTTLPLKASQGDIPIAVPSIGVAEAATPEKAKLESSFKIPTPPNISQASLPEKRTPVPQVPQFTPFKKPVLKQPEVSPVKAVEPLPKDDLFPLKERPSQGSCISGEFLKKTKSSPLKKVAGNLEKERLKRARKLRDLLRDELRKERRASKEKFTSVDYSDEIDRSKMTMRDFVHYIPENNPMTSSISDKNTSDKPATVESPSAGSEMKSAPREDEDDLDEEEDEGPLLVPRVKVAEDGSIILDEESLTVEVSRTKGPIVENGDPIFERGSTTTYTSFRKSKYSKPWSEKETDMFFLAISMVGTDFSMITHLFPHRQRIEIKNKFKREERLNGWRIDKAFREKKAFDQQLFAELLERALIQEVKKPKAPKTPKAKGEKGNKPRKPRKKQKDKASAEQDSNLGDPEVEAVDSGTAEKENEESQTVIGDEPTPLPGKKKRARKKKNEAQSVEPEDLSECQNKPSTLPAKEGKSRKKILIPLIGKGEALDISADPETVDPTEMETAEGEESVDAEKIQEKKKKRRQKKKPIIVESDSECQSGSDVLHIAEEEDSGSKEFNATLDSSVESCDQSVQEATEGSTNAVAEEILSGDDGDDGTLEPYEDDDDDGDELLSMQEDTLVSNEQDSVVLLASDISLFDNSSISIADTQVETSPVESLQEATDHKMTVSTTEKPQECDIQEDSGARTREPSASEDEFIQSCTKSSPVGKGRIQKPKPNLPKLSNRRGGQENRGDIPEGRIEVATEDNTTTFQNSEDDKSTNIPMSTPNNEDSVEKEESAIKSQVSSTSLLGSTQTPIKPTPVVRFQRPKPNLTASSRKLEDRGDIQEEGSKMSTEEPAEGDRGPVVGMPGPKNISMNIPLISQEEDSPEDQENSCDKKEESVSQVECTSSPVISLPSARGRLQRPKPNLLSISRKGKKEVKADIQSSEAANEDTVKTIDYMKEESCAIGKPQEHVLDTLLTEESSTAGIASAVSCPDTFKTTLTMNAEADGHKRDVGSDEPEKNSEPMQKSTSEEQQAPSPVKATPLSRSRFQKPKPNLMKTSVRKGKEGNKVSADNLAEIPQDKKEDTSLSEMLELQLKEPEISSVDEEKVPNCRQSSAGSMLPSTVAPDSITETLEAKGTSNNSQQTRKQEPLRPAVLPRGRFQKPKPNVGRAAAAKKEVLSSQELSSDGTSTAASDQSMEHMEYHLPTVSENKEQSHLISRDKGKEGSLSPNEPESSSNATVQEDKEKDNATAISIQELEHTKGGPAQESLKPAVPLKGRYQRPKPNLSRAAAHKDSSACLKNTSCETVEQQQQSASSAPKVEIMVMPGLPEKLSGLAENSEAPQVCSKNGQNNSTTDLKQDDILQQQSVNKDSQSNSAVQPSPIRGRFQRPKPNLLRAIAKKATSKPSDDEKAKEAGDSKTDLISETKGSDAESSQQLSVEEHQPTSGSPLHSSGHGSGEKDISPAAGTTLAEEPGSLNKEDNSSPAIKPAPLRRGRILRLKPNLVNVPCRRESQGWDQTKAASDDATDSGGAAECVPLPESHITDALGKAPANKRKATDKSSVKLLAKKIRSSDIAETQSSLSESESDRGSLDIEGQESTAATRTRFGRKVKNSIPEKPQVQPKGTDNVSDLEKGRNAQNAKSNGSKIKAARPVSRKGTALVKLRASRWEEQDDDDEELDFKDESFNLSPDKVNQAPVFVPFSLRSLKHGPAEIEETVEELIIPVDILDSHTIPETQNNNPISEESENSSSLKSDELSSDVTDSESVTADKGTKDCSDGSTEAAMTLISMGNPVFQSRVHEESSNLKEDLSSSSETQSDLQHLDPVNSLSLPSELGPIHTGLPSGEIVEAHEATAEVIDTHVHTFEEGNGDPAKMQPRAESLDGSVGATESGIILLECLPSNSSDLRLSGESDAPSDATCEVQLEQSEKHSEEVQHSIVPDGDNLSGENECPAEEATFILTLVEIPINSEYPYSCDSLSSEEPLPAPVLISSGSAQPVTLTQSSSSESAEVSVRLPSEQCSTSGEESNCSWSSSSAPRKRTASRQDDGSPSVKRALLMCDKPEESSEDSGTEARNSPESSTTNTQEITSPEAVCDNVTEPSQDSELSGDALSGVETLPEGSPDSRSLDDSLPAIAAGDATSKQQGVMDALHFSCINTLPSTSTTPIKRPGWKPMGFLSLVCKNKNNKANNPSNRKKRVLKPNVCKKPPSTAVQSQDVTVSEVSDSQAATSKTLGANEVASEEEGTTVSQYFFSDIFMPVDDE